MEMVGKNGKAKDFNRYVFGQKLKPFSNLLAAMFVVLSADRIFPAQKPATHTAINAMNNVDFVLRTTFSTTQTSHCTNSN